MQYVTYGGCYWFCVIGTSKGGPIQPRDKMDHIIRHSSSAELATLFKPSSDTQMWTKNTLITCFQMENPKERRGWIGLSYYFLDVDGDTLFLPNLFFRRQPCAERLKWKSTLTRGLFTNNTGVMTRCGLTIAMMKICLQLKK